ncbi:cytoplasmic protein, partial [Priestia megaterium]
MRPELSKNLSITDFTDVYWLKTELQECCRENNMSTSGFKMELSKRIEVFLTTGEAQQSKKPSKRR